MSYDTWKSAGPHEDMPSVGHDVLEDDELHPHAEGNVRAARGTLESLIHELEHAANSAERGSIGAAKSSINMAQVFANLARLHLALAFEKEGEDR